MGRGTIADARGFAAPARLLVVDDDPSVLLTIAAILSGEGYAVTSAGSVAEALGHLRTAPFDLVLTDLRLEGESGLTLLAELRRHWPETTAVMLTGYASLESAIDALREGAYDYLVKPCDVDELKATVARAVERGVLARTLRERLADLEAANAQIRSFADQLQQRVDEATAELNRKVEELSEAKAHLEEAQRQREEFISMVTHELNQPVTSIRAYAQLLGRPGLTPERQDRARESIVSETRRLERLTRDLADASRMAAGRFQVALGSYDLAEIVREQVELARARAEQHTIRFEGPADAPPSLCDRDRVAQVVSNLLANAMKYTPGGEIRVRIDVEDTRALITVRDQGPGIPPERLEDIFEPHVRLPGGASASGERPKGSGLGLYIARGIVEAHGGRIWAENSPAGGASFTFCLPLAPRESPAPVGAEGGDAAWPRAC